METPPKTDSLPTTVEAPKTTATPKVEFVTGVLQEIRQHARSSMHAEICGVLIGEVANGVTRVSARIPGEGASQGGAHVTFTQEAWEHIYKIKDATYPDQSIVGWYHSHPGFGIFLSDYDLFIHENFFTAQHQIAWVFDPHSDEEGCFGWVDKKVEPLHEVVVTREHRPPTAEQAQEEAAGRKAGPADEPPRAPGVTKSTEAPARLGGVVLVVAVALAAFVAGVLSYPYVDALKRTVSGLFSVETRTIERTGPPSSAESAQNSNPVIRINVAPAPAAIGAPVANDPTPATAPAPATVPPPPPPAPPQLDKTAGPLPDAPANEPPAAGPKEQPETPAKPVPPQP